MDRLPSGGERAVAPLHRRSGIAVLLAMAIGLADAPLATQVQAKGQSQSQSQSLAESQVRSPVAVPAVEGVLSPAPPAAPQPVAALPVAASAGDAAAVPPVASGSAAAPAPRGATAPAALSGATAAPAPRGATAPAALSGATAAPAPSGAAAAAAPAHLAVPPAADPRRLSLQQALELGLQGSLSLRGSTLTVQEAQAQVALVRSRWLPRLDLVGLGTYGQVGTSFGFISNLPSIGDLSLAVGDDGYAVVQNTFLNIGLVLNLPLLDFGRAPLQRAARFDLQAAREELSEQERRSRFDIISAYLNAQLAAAQIPVWQRAIDLSSTLLRDVNAIRRRGLAARIDTFQAEALLQTDRQGLAEAEAQQAVARSLLARALNLEPAVQVEASDPLQPWAGWHLALEPTLVHALEQRPALQALQQQRQAQLARVQLARASRLPSVGLLVGGG
ncbi:MAG: TolC family protein, partial [Cyanobium sp.]